MGALDRLFGRSASTIAAAESVTGGAAMGQVAQGLAGWQTAHQGASRDDLAMAGWDPTRGSADADLLPELETLLTRSRDMVRNNGLMAGAMQTYRDNIVGAVLRAVPMPDYRLLGWDLTQAHDWSRNTAAEFRSYADTTDCDAGRTLNMIGLAFQALTGAFVNGDGLGLPMWLPRADARWSTRIMMIESDRLQTPPHLVWRNDVRGGIQFDEYGAPVNYNFLKRHPGDILSGITGTNGIADPWAYETVPAFTPWGRRRVLHLHDKERTGQSRGKPIITAVIREFHLAGKYSSNELQASVASSLVAAFLESNLDQKSSEELFGDDPRATWATSMGEARGIRSLKGAAVIPVPIGAKVTGFAPNRPNSAFEAFMLAVLRHIAAGLNLPYELLVKDFSKTNYSSARAALLEAWRFFMGRRRWLTDYWLRPIYELWLEEAVNAGVIDAPDFYAKRFAYCRCRFIFGGKGWVDPVKEAQAAILRVAGGLSTLEQECAEQGLDYEEVLDQRALERQMMIDRGLNPDAATAATANAAATKALDETEREEGSTDGSNSAAADAEAMRSAMRVIKEGALA
jgi:lambda family phage portal protein